MCLLIHSSQILDKPEAQLVELNMANKLLPPFMSPQDKAFLQSLLAQRKVSLTL